jgi:pseudouridine synthase, rluA family
MIWEVAKEEEGQRLDKYLSEQKDHDFSRSYLGKCIQEGCVSVNGEKAKASLKVKAGDRIDFDIPEQKDPEVLPEAIPLDIVYEDDDLLVVNKERGMVVHPAAGHYSGTLVNAVLAHAGSSLSSINGVNRPGIVHRIDKDTTGLLLICKNDLSHQSLAKQLEEHSITRRYHALVFGKIKEEDGIISAPIGRDEKDRKKQAISYKHGKEAVTHYKVLERFSDSTLVECRLETGRTHQIRVHMKSIGHPLLGDPVYGLKNRKDGISGQALHAMILGFQHPRTGEYMEFSAPYPADFQALLEKLRKKG